MVDKNRKRVYNINAYLNQTEDNMDIEKAKEIILGDNYYSINDLRYNKKIGIMLSRGEFEDFLRIKDHLAQ